jgi:tripartite-type tricarboxylate transporter receptor subunit TctC
LRMTRTLALLVLALAACADAAVQAYPAKPLRVIVPFPPGGGNDIVARIVANKLSERLKQPLVIENRGGAGGTIGTEMTAKAAPDGYTLLINNISLAVNATLMPKLGYDTVKDLAPVSIIGRQPNIVVVSPGLKAATMREFLALAKARAGELNYGTGGIGTASHLATELLQLETGTRMNHIPYKGLGPALLDLAGGRIDMIISTIASVLPFIESGKVRPLATTTLKRSSFLPQVPTMGEAGVQGYEFDTWYALVVPAATPEPVVARLNGELARLTEDAGMKEQFEKQGLEVAHTGTAEARAYLRSEVEKWGRVIKASGAKAE